MADQELNLNINLDEIRYTELVAGANTRDAKIP